MAIDNEQKTWKTPILTVLTSIEVNETVLGGGSGGTDPELPPDLPPTT